MIKPLGIADLLTNSNSNVLPVRMQDWLATRLNGVVDHPRNTAIFLLGILPTISLGIHVAVTGSVGTIEWVIAPTYSLVIMLALRAASKSWDELVAIGPEIDEVLGDSAPVTAERFVPLLRLGYQWAAFVMGALASIAVSVLMDDAMRSSDETGASYVFTIAWTGAFGALIIYWIWSAPFVLWMATRVKEPSVFVLDPLRTPGLLDARKVMSSSAKRCLIGLLFFSIPIGLTVLKFPDETLVLAMGAIALGVSILTVLFIAVGPQLFVGKVASTGRANELDRIRDALAEANGEGEAKVERALMDRYSRVASAETSLFDGGRLAELAFQFFVAAAPIAIPLAEAILK